MQRGAGRTGTWWKPTSVSIPWLLASYIYISPVTPKNHQSRAWQPHGQVFHHQVSYRVRFLQLSFPFQQSAGLALRTLLQEHHRCECHTLRSGNLTFIYSPSTAGPMINPHWDLHLDDLSHAQGAHVLHRKSAGEFDRRAKVRLLSTPSHSGKSSNLPQTCARDLGLKVSDYSLLEVAHLPFHTRYTLPVYSPSSYSAQEVASCFCLISLTWSGGRKHDVAS